MSEVTFWTTSAAPGKELSYWKKATCEAVFEVELEAVDVTEPLVLLTARVAVVPATPAGTV